MQGCDPGEKIVDSQTNGKFDVGGVMLDQPFKIRRLGHFGFNAYRMDDCLHFYHSLLGFRIVDSANIYEGKDVPEAFKEFGNMTRYFFRYGHDHHAFVLYNHRHRGAMDKLGRWRKNITVNQITWQVGSLAEVVNGHKWMVDNGVNVVRAGRDMPGSNWHVYVMDPDWFQNELYYGMEQIGWQGNSKPKAMGMRGFDEAPDLPQISEYHEVNDARAKGTDLLSGYRDTEPMPETYDVDGVLLGRPFKIVKHGPVRLFCEDLEGSLEFYRDTLGFIPTEEVDYQGHRCVFLRNNTEHHSLALYPVALRKALGVREDTLLFSFGVQLANYRQLRDAVGFLREHGMEIRDLPPEITPGMDHTTFAVDPDGHLVQLYYYMEQLGWDGKPCPADRRRKVTPGDWPETVAPLQDTYMGEPFLGPWS